MHSPYFISIPLNIRIVLLNSDKLLNFSWNSEQKVTDKLLSSLNWKSTVRHFFDHIFSSIFILLGQYFVDFSKNQYQFQYHMFVQVTHSVRAYFQYFIFFSLLRPDTGVGLMSFRGKTIFLAMFMTPFVVFVNTIFCVSTRAHGIIHCLRKRACVRVCLCLYRMSGNMFNFIVIRTKAL